MQPKASQPPKPTKQINQRKKIHKHITNKKLNKKEKKKTGLITDEGETLKSWV